MNNGSTTATIARLFHRPPIRASRYASGNPSSRHSAVDHSATPTVVRSTPT